MRFWFSFPRTLGIRPGISFSPQDFAAKERPKQQPKTAGEPIQGSFVYVIRGDHNLGRAATLPSRAFHRLSNQEIKLPTKKVTT